MTVNATKDFFVFGILQKFCEGGLEKFQFQILAPHRRRPGERFGDQPATAPSVISDAFDALKNFCEDWATSSPLDKRHQIANPA